jgi:hypothetical protein
MKGPSFGAAKSSQFRALRRIGVNYFILDFAATFVATASASQTLGRIFHFDTGKWRTIE